MKNNFSSPIFLLSLSISVSIINAIDALSRLAAVLADQSYSDSSSIGPIEDAQRTDRVAHEKFLEALKILREAGSIYSAGLIDLENLGTEILQKEENPVSSLQKQILFTRLFLNLFLNLFSHVVFFA